MVTPLNQIAYEGDSPVKGGDASLLFTMGVGDHNPIFLAIVVSFRVAREEIKNKLL